MLRVTVRWRRSYSRVPLPRAIADEKLLQSGAAVGLNMRNGQWVQGERS